MNKTVTITLNGVIFHIEEDAYTKLNEYLNSIKEHYSSSDDTSEMMSDIECSIADKFQTKISNKKKVITERDVNNVIKVMGRVEEIDGEISGAEAGKIEINEPKISGESKNDEKKIKKLYRNPDDVIIAGVCSGIAEYFGVDSVFIRLGFVALMFAGGVSIWIYLVLWLVMPTAITRAQKLEMHGDPVTLKKLEESLKKKINKEKREEIEQEVRTVGSNVGKIVSLPFRFIGDVFKAIFNFFKKLFPLLASLIGAVISFGMIMGVIALTFVTGVMIFKIDSPYINSDIPVKEIVGGVSYSIWAVSLFVVAVIPVLMILIAGISLMRRKNVFNFLSVGILFSLWALSIVVFGVIAIDAVPQLKNRIEEVEKIDVVSRDYDENDFNRILVSNNIRATVTRGDEYSIIARGRDRDLEKLEITKENDGDLVIRKKNNYENDFCLFCFEKELEVDVVMPEIQNINVSDYSRVELNDFENFNLKASINDVSRLTLDTPNLDLDLDVNDYSRVYIKNYLNSINAQVNDASRVEIDKCDSCEMDFTINDYSRISVVSELMSQNASSSSSTISKLTADLNDSSKLTVTKTIFGNIDIDMDDSSKTSIDGEAELLNADLSGYSDLEAIGLEVKSAEVKLSGYSKAELEVLEKLNVFARGGSKMSYKGRPEIEKDLGGSSRLSEYDR
jgi:phage shock protein PspC (stress-responsive transcriptional regulator)